jgi:hypothetical protein
MGTPNTRNPRHTGSTRYGTVRIAAGVQYVKIRYPRRYRVYGTCCATTNEEDTITTKRIDHEADTTDMDDSNQAQQGEPPYQGTPHGFPQ